MVGTAAPYEWKSETSTGGLFHVRRRWFVLVLGLVLVATGLTAYRYVYEARVDPELLLRSSLEKTRAASSYRYTVEAQLTVAGEHRVLSQVTGERDADGNFHFRGELAGEKTEVYQIQDTTYLLDPKTGKWLVVPGNELGRQKMLMAEIDPLSLLEFTALGPVVYRGREKGEWGRAHVVEFRPQLAGEFMNTWFEEFRYQVWIEPRTYWLRQAVVTAQSKANPTVQATFTVRLSDFGVKLKLEPPA